MNSFCFRDYWNLEGEGERRYTEKLAELTNLSSLGEDGVFLSSLLISFILALRIELRSCRLRVTPVLTSSNR